MIERQHIDNLLLLFDEARKIFLNIDNLATHKIDVSQFEHNKETGILWQRDINKLWKNAVKEMNDNFYTMDHRGRLVYLSKIINFILPICQLFAMLDNRNTDNYNGNNEDEFTLNPKVEETFKGNEFLLLFIAFCKSAMTQFVISIDMLKKDYALNELDISNLKRFILNQKKSTPIKPTRAGLAVALIYLERFGNLPTQRNNIALYSNKYKTNEANTRQQYDGFKEYENILFTSVTTHGKSVNARLEALENALQIIDNEKNEKALNKLKNDINTFKKHYSL